MQPSTGGQARKHLANGEGQSAWSTPPDGRRNAANSGTKEDALSRRMAGLGLSSPGASKSPSALQQRSPWGEQSSFVSYSEGFSEQATHGSVNSLTPAASDSCADSALLSHKQQLGTPVSAQSCVGSNELPLSHSRRAPVTPGSAASVTSRLAKTDGAGPARTHTAAGRTEAPDCYACAVLQDAGHAVEGLSVPVLDAIMGSRQVAQQAPDLATRLHAVLDRRRLGDAGAGRGYEQGIAGSAFELHAFNSDGLQKRSKEEQQRVTNQEAVRDEWFCLLKAALANASPLGRTQEQSGMQSRSGHMLLDKDGEAAVLSVLVDGAGRLLRGVASGNLGAFSRLFCAAVLQAAATGEALLDSELGALAARDPSRFSRLNQRLQGQSGGPSRGGPRMQPSLYHARSPGPSVSHMSSVSEAGWSQNRPQQQHRKKPAKGLDDGSGASLEVAAMFPLAQRLFVLFLEAADSHRLNTHLATCMQERMQELMAEALAERGSGTAQKCEQALALAILASYLSYLTFGTAGGRRAYQMLDLEGAVRSAAQKGALLWTLPWVNSYLWFLQPPAHTPAPLSPRLLAQLSQLRAAAALKPSHEAFGPAALCLRCLLDELLERLGPPRPADSSPKPDLLELVPGDALESSLAIENELDARFLLLCTPQLEQARHALQAGPAAAAPRVSAPMSKGLRKITPTAPFRPTAAAAAPSPDVHLEMAAAIARAADTVQRQLQSAFLGMYSNPESKVRLKSVVDFVGDMLGHTVKAAAAKVAAAAANEEAAQQLHPLMQSSVEALRTADQPVTSEALKASLQLRIPDVRDKALNKAVGEACRSAVHHAEANAVQAVAALAHPSWTPAVIGAAAAIAADNAVASCAQQLVTEVSNQVALIVQAQMDDMVSAKLKLSV
ncbi:hypothetical protein WJX75_000422 [Coccomyxa subellipsoidea]|uniref:Codanin-1 C-terminal domain-containing protein n=1 Tax=Coccomyxa subellipsoidea TaxID=248742 RepID=A0ABR2YAQ1_9CHLO